MSIDDRELSLSPVLQTAAEDISAGLRQRNIALVFGWQDIAQRYRRSRVGAFWLTINMGVLIGAMGLIFGTLFRIEWQVFLPHVASGIVVWTLISSSINEGCNAFIAAEGMILQVRLPLFTHVLRLLWRNFLIFLHNLAIIPLVLLIVMQTPTAAILLLPIGLVLVVVNLMWMVLFLGTLCTRFRDMPQVVQNIVQVAFYATPIMWTAATLPSGPAQFVLLLNPFYHLVEMLRLPMLGEVPSLTSYVIVLGMALVGWLAAMLFFGRFRWRIPYWL